MLARPAEAKCGLSLGSSQSRGRLRWCREGFPCSPDSGNKCLAWDAGETAPVPSGSKRRHHDSIGLQGVSHSGSQGQRGPAEAEAEEGLSVHGRGPGKATMRDGAWVSSGAGVESGLLGFLCRRLCYGAPASVAGPAPALTPESGKSLSFSLRQPLSQERHTSVADPEGQDVGGRWLVTVCIQSPAVLEVLESCLQRLPGWLQQPVEEPPGTEWGITWRGDLPGNKGCILTTCSSSLGPAAGWSGWGTHRPLMALRNFQGCGKEPWEGHRYPQAVRPGTRPTLTSRYPTVRCLTGSLFSLAFCGWWPEESLGIKLTGIRGIPGCFCLFVQC